MNCLLSCLLLKRSPSTFTFPFSAALFFFVIVIFSSLSRDLLLFGPVLLLSKSFGWSIQYLSEDKLEKLYLPDLYLPLSYISPRASVVKRGINYQLLLADILYDILS